MPCDVPHVVDDDRVGLAVRRAQRPAELLNKQRVRLRWAGHRNDLDRRQIEALAEQIDVDQLHDLAGLELTQDLRTPHRMSLRRDDLGSDSGSVVRGGGLCRALDVGVERDPQFSPGEFAGSAPPRRR